MIVLLVGRVAIGGADAGPSCGAICHTFQPRYLDIVITTPSAFVVGGRPGSESCSGVGTFAPVGMPSNLATIVEACNTPTLDWVISETRPANWGSVDGGCIPVSGAGSAGTVGAGADGVGVGRGTASECGAPRHMATAPTVAASAVPTAARVVGCGERARRRS